MARKSNLTTTLRRRRVDTMQAFDALPPPARQWLAGAKLPWSALSVGRLWQKALREARGDMALALQRLDAAQERLIARDQARLWRGL